MVSTLNKLLDVEFIKYIVLINMGINTIKKYFQLPNSPMYAVQKDGGAY